VSGSTSLGTSPRCCACLLNLVFNEGYSGDVDLAAEAIQLTRQLAAKTKHEGVASLLALMLLHHARRLARTRTDGSIPERDHLTRQAARLNAQLRN
jgi:predicted RNA polymerase sigma factor